MNRRELFSSLLGMIGLAAVPSRQTHAVSMSRELFETTSPGSGWRTFVPGGVITITYCDSDGNHVVRTVNKPVREIEVTVSHAGCRDHLGE
jgi:hypothetical protein